MKKLLLFSLIVSLCLPLLLSAQTEAPEMDFPRLEGPATATLAGVAQIEVPPGYIYIDGPTMRKLLEAIGQPVSDDLIGSLSPTNADWSVMFYYDAIGYVKDDDKDKLNADKLLEDYRKGTEEANKYRAKYGAAPIQVLGWELPPRYNEETHNLEWALRGSSEGEEILNYDTRLLGRKGVMSVKLIVSPQEYAATFPVFTNLIAGYKFNSGETYAEYKPGDKIAKYGLGALVLGGAAVGAAKLGLFAWLAVFLKKGWKFVVILVVAVAAVFKKAINRIVNGGRGQD
jgi:uncharacterized membrane-anchored protein